MSRAVRDAELIHLRQVRLAAERLAISLKSRLTHPELEPIQRPYGVLVKVLAEGSPDSITEVHHG